MSRFPVGAGDRFLIEQMFVDNLKYIQYNKYIEENAARKCEGENQHA